MQDVLKPAIGSNQFLTKFIEEPKKKAKFSFKKLAKDVITSKKTWKTLFVIVSLASMFGTYYFAKQAYNFSCEVNGEVVGYFTKKSTCDEILQNKYAALELGRQEILKNNPDLQ